MSRTSTSVHQVASRASGAVLLVGQPDLGELEAPVAVLVPDRLVDEPGHLAEGVARHRLVDRLGRGGGARQEPALGGAEVARIGNASLGALGDGRRPRADHEARRVPELVGEVAGVLQLGRAEALVVARRRAVDEREAQRVGPRFVDRRRADRRTLPLVFDIFWPSGSRISPDR